MNTLADPLADDRDIAELIRVRGLVQGVGFRPTVWLLARRHGLRGWVANDGDGVIIRLRGSAKAIERLIVSLADEAPPLARIDRIERTASAPSPDDAAFRIINSIPTRARTGVVPDAATCPQCRAEVFDAFERRYRYPFTNCTHCGPRLSIIEAIPYDRQSTTMRKFAVCPACAAEYGAPDDRRFHAQPIACHACGPRAWLERGDGRPLALDAITTLDDVDGAATLLMRGQILAIKGLGGFQLACDATNPEAVARLRERKRRPRKPLALMVRDIDVARAWCDIDAQEADMMRSAAAPIVIVKPRADGLRVAATIAPGVGTLGVMLPNTPLHHLMLRRMDRPIVLTSGNLSDEPQCIDNAEARQTLGGIADYFLMHDRDIARRVDDSIVRIIGGKPRIMRRARGYAPAPMRAAGGLRAPHHRSLPWVVNSRARSACCATARPSCRTTWAIWRTPRPSPTTHSRSRRISDCSSTCRRSSPSIAIPSICPPSSGAIWPRGRRPDLAEVQHHHAHIAACLAENGIALDAAPVLGVALDGWVRAGRHALGRRIPAGRLPRLPTAGDVQAGRHAGRRPGDPRALAQHLRASHG